MDAQGINMIGHRRPGLKFLFQVTLKIKQRVDIGYSFSDVTAPAIS